MIVVVCCLLFELLFAQALVRRRVVDRLSLEFLNECSFGRVVS